MRLPRLLGHANRALSRERIRRYRRFIRLLIRHGGAAWLDVGPPGHPLIEQELRDEPEVIRGRPDVLADDLEALGPTFVKLGQMLSVRPDLLPPAYLEALSRLQDRVEPLPFEELRPVLEDDLGRPVEAVFAKIDHEPLAAASLGQVHCATLPDGREVAVKIQRPGIREQIIDDLDDLEGIATLLEQHTELGRRLGFSALAEEFRQTLLTELDYRQEAENLRVLGEHMARYETLWVPAPVTDASGQRVLTMERIVGTKITNLDPGAAGEAAEGLVADLCRGYLDQALIHGFVHADPHPGNLFVTGDRRLALVDLGLVSRLAPHRRGQLLQFLMAVNDGRGREAAELGIAMSRPLEHIDSDRLERQVSDLLARHRHGAGAYRKVGRVVLELTRIAATNGVRPAAELILLGKTLLYLDQVAEIMAPDYDPNPVIRRHAAAILRQRVGRSFQPRRLLPALLDAQELIERLPGRLNRGLEALSRQQMRVKLDVVDETRLMKSLEKIANRITVGLVLASLIVGAALMMQVDTAWRLFGYPALAIILFGVAALIGLGLVIDILFFNRNRSRRH